MAVRFYLNYVGLAFDQNRMHQSFQCEIEPRVEIVLEKLKCQVALVRRKLDSDASLYRLLIQVINGDTSDFLLEYPVQVVKS